MSCSLHSSRNRGFTLLEILIALLAFGLIMAAAYSTLNSLARADRARSDASQQLQQLQLAMTLIERDIRQMVVIPNGYGASVQQPGCQGNQHQLRLLRSGWKNSLNQNRSELQDVFYFITDNSLMRGYSFNTDGEMINQQALIGDLKQLRWFYQTGGGGWTQECIVSNTPVSAIRLEFTLNDGQQFSRLFATVART